MTPIRRGALAIILSFMLTPALPGDSLTLGEPLSIHEETVPVGMATPSNLQLVAGRDSFLLLWLATHRASYPDLGPHEWIATVLSPDGRPLRPEPFRLRADTVRIVRSGDGFAAISIEGTVLSVRHFDPLGNPVTGPQPVHDSARGYQGMVAASNGREIVVVWTEGQPRNDQPPLIRGIMIHPDGRIDEGIIRDTTPRPPLPGVPWSSALSLGSNGTDFLLGWDDCLKSGSRWYSLECTVSSRVIVTAGPGLRETQQLLPPETTYEGFVGPIASNGTDWSLLTARGLFLIDAGGAPLCSDGSDHDVLAQLTWDGRDFILVRGEPNYGTDVRVARLSEPCARGSAEGSLGAAGRHGKQIAVASLGDGSSLVAYTEWTDSYSAEVPDDVRIIVQKGRFRDEGRSRPVRRTGP